VEICARWRGMQRWWRSGMRVEDFRRDYLNFIALYAANLNRKLSLQL
jgi:hypothetical protein